jgi:hypothetical protein
MYNPKNCITVTLLIAGIILGMLLLKTQEPKYINNHTERKNTATNIIIWLVDKLDISFGSMLVNACFCEGVMDATVLAIAETRDVIILIYLVIIYLVKIYLVICFVIS